MNYGLQVFNEVGIKTFDPSRLGGVFVEFVTITQGTTGSRTYPTFNGRTLFGMHYYNGLTNTATAWSCWTISHPSGVPTLSWNYPAASGGVAVELILFVR